jgi:formate dehydrogenase iron-sulfur subunit
MTTMGFFTDTTVCIGCKACEVACKEWNQLPDDGFTFTGMSYDNTSALGASTWRHVAFVERPVPMVPDELQQPFSWLMMSDVCKHCERAGCLENCPTGAIIRTEFGSVYVQPDVCNGCGYCIVGCPFGVIDRRPDDGRAWKCTLCYDRLTDGLKPACANGLHAFFLLVDRPEVYNLPPEPMVPTKRTAESWAAAAMGAAGIALAALVAVGRRR